MCMYRVWSNGQNTLFFETAFNEIDYDVRFTNSGITNQNHLVFVNLITTLRIFLRIRGHFKISSEMPSLNFWYFLSILFCFWKLEQLSRIKIVHISQDNSLWGTIYLQHLFLLFVTLSSRRMDLDLALLILSNCDNGILTSISLLNASFIFSPVLALVSKQLTSNSLQKVFASLYATSRLFSVSLVRSSLFPITI